MIFGCWTVAERIGTDVQWLSPHVTAFTVLAARDFHKPYRGHDPRLQNRRFPPHVRRGSQAMNSMPPLFCAGADCAVAFWLPAARIC